MALNDGVAPKHPGDPIKSDDWNALATETNRLDGAKLDTTGGTVTGPLSVTGKLTAPEVNSPSIGLQMLKGTGGLWSSNDWHPMIDQMIDFPASVSLLLIGQGIGLSETRTVPLDVVTRVDGTILGQDGNTLWGAGILQPFFNSGDFHAWTPMVAMGGCQVAKGRHQIELLMRRRGTAGDVQFGNPTLWLIRLGAPDGSMPLMPGRTN